MSRCRLWVVVLLTFFIAACTAGPEASGGMAQAVEQEPDVAPTEAPVEMAAPTEAPPPPTEAPTVTPEPTSAPVALAPAFAIHGEEPVIVHGPPGAWDGRFTDPGAALYHDGMYHMFRNGFAQWPGAVGIAHHISADGRVWEATREEPVLTGEDVPFAEYTALASSALVEPDGTWVLYLYTWDSTAPSGPSRIGRATAPAPEGPWTVDEAPILVQGSEGEWDDYNVQAPSVVRTDDGYVMYYTGSRQSPASRKIGMATSTDGVTWSKYDDPATTDAPHAESDPILAAMVDADAWNGQVIHQPKVVQTGDGWVMLFRGMGLPNKHGYGVATSEDGIHWEQYEGNPVFAPADVAGQGAWFHEFIHQEDTYYFFVEVGRQGGTDIFLATHEGSLWQ